MGLQVQEEKPCSHKVPVHIALPWPCGHWKQQNSQRRCTLEVGLMAQRPFRSPHHTISDVALVGGGAYLTRRNILVTMGFILDELPDAPLLEVMRQPLEDREVFLGQSLRWPIRLVVYACGEHEPKSRAILVTWCSCSKAMTNAAIFEQNIRLLLDRIDIHTPLTPVPHNWKLTEERLAEGSTVMKTAVTATATCKQSALRKSQNAL
jgi:magnesium chelatase family protein